MAETTTSSSAEDRALDALTKILETAISPEMLAAQQVILRRLALSGDLFPSRIPPPRNITEVGGYLNLLEDQYELRQQVLASAMGVAGPNPQAGWEPNLPTLWFASRANDRPDFPGQPTIPIQYTVRNDLAGPLDTAVASLHAVGATLPVLRMAWPLPTLPPGAAATPVVDATTLLGVLGRVLELVPASALSDPAVDPLALGSPTAGGDLDVLARQVDATAPDAGTVAAADWDVWSCDATTCTQATVNAAYVPLTPVLNGAGWYHAGLTAPTSVGDTGAWHRWTNVTGLVAGTSTLGAELSLLYDPGTIATSPLRDQLDWTWDGSTFTPPA